MKMIKRRSVATVACVGLCLWPLSVFATTSVPTAYTNDNFLHRVHDAPTTFTRDAQGNFSGVTKTGKRFYQRVVTNTLSVRLQRFSIDEAAFYMSDRGLIWADTDTAALSIYLSRAT